MGVAGDASCPKQRPLIEKTEPKTSCKRENSRHGGSAETASQNHKLELGGGAS